MRRLEKLLKYIEEETSNIPENKEDYEYFSELAFKVYEMLSSRKKEYTLKFFEVDRAVELDEVKIYFPGNEILKLWSNVSYIVKNGEEIKPENPKILEVFRNLFYYYEREVYKCILEKGYW